MRETRTYGSEGGEAELNRPSLPLSAYNRKPEKPVRNPGKVYPEVAVGALPGYVM